MCQPTDFNESRIKPFLFGQERDNRPVPTFPIGGLENESTIDHSGNAVVKTLTLSLDAREPHGCESDSAEQKVKV
jgi:hypothetical protein